MRQTYGVVRKGIVLVLLSMLPMGACRVYLPHDNYPRIIDFAGFSWRVKHSEEPVGPGPNVFSGRDENVWVDNKGFLHLKVTNHNGYWQCAEVMSLDRFSFGRYRFDLASEIDNLDPWLVLGMFTWNPASRHHNREVDIEITRLGNPGLSNAQYVVQPYELPDHRHRFELMQNDILTRHEITWSRGSIGFRSLNGHDRSGNPSSLISEWTFNSGMIRQPGRIQVRMNLWLFKGKAPANLKEIEVVIRDFHYTPFALLPPGEG